MIYPISLSRALEVSWRTHMPSGTTRRSRVVTPKTTRSPWQSWPRAWRPSVNRDWEEPGWQFDINNFGLNFSLKNNFSFGSRFPTYTKKKFKTGQFRHITVSKWKLKPFFKQKLKPKMCLLNCHQVAWTRALGATPSW